MRAVVQRVKASHVSVDGQIVGQIKMGLNVLLGVEAGDDAKDMTYMAEKILNLRIFEDQDEKMNFSLKDIEGEMLVISQFTLLGDCRKGRRPSFVEAAKPQEANALYEAFVAYCTKAVKVETGVFQADMQVHIENDGPVTMMLDSKKNF